MYYYYYYYEYRYSMAGQAEFTFLPVGVLLVSCTEACTGRIRSIPTVFHSPPLVKQTLRGIYYLKSNVESINKSIISKYEYLDSCCLL